MARSRKARPSPHRDDEGVTAAEYAIMLAMIILGAIVGITALGGSTTGLWNSNASKIGASSAS